MDPKKAAGLTYKINLVTPDNGEQYAIELANATLTNMKGFLAPTPDLTIIHKLRDLMVTFTPDFEILPGTAPTERQVPPGRSFALPPIGVILGD
jgi:alkyl sulfatase BDS1-like metallo-beta-lactamase superfamily hydrolase